MGDEEQELSDEDAAEVITDEIKTSFWHYAYDYSSVSIPMALSYTFSMEVVLTMLLFSQLNSEHEADIAAMGLISVMMNTTIFRTRRKVSK